MRLDIDDQRFAASAIRWLGSLDDATLADTVAVFEASPGYYPTTLLALRQRELARRGLASTTQRQLEVQARSTLPVCHPADYDWRFSETTAEWLLELATNTLQTRGLVVHMGTPTTFALGVERFRHHEHVLMERSGATIRSLAGCDDQTNRLVRIDLATDRTPTLEADVAIVDPPWYPDDTAMFLAGTTQAVRLGAVILLCQPTVATRPGVQDERIALLAALPRLGLKHRDTHRATVRYITPHFESMSLRTAIDAGGVPWDWRKGDLLVLEKVAPAESERQVRTGGEVWSEAQFGPVRVKLRGVGASDLEPLVPGDVLNTVSRRDPVRRCIGFWTSGNRVFGLARPIIIGQLIDLCHSDLMHGSFNWHRAAIHSEVLAVPESVTRKLVEILSVELKEHCQM